MTTQTPYRYRKNYWCHSPKSLTRLKVRARPLSDTNPEISKYMEAVSGPGAGGGTAIASLGRRGRGDADADSMGYDEVGAILLSFPDADSI